MSYMAYLCYPHSYDDEDDNESVIKFEEPEQWKYETVIPIQFDVLHRWDDHKRPKGMRLYP
jgi:hypothetical protein